MMNSTKVKVYYKDTDAGGVVYYGNYLGWLEMGRAGLVEDLGISQKRLMEEKGTVFAIREVNVRYLAPAVLHDLLEVATSIDEVTGATVVFRQEIMRPSDGARIIEAKVIAFALDLKSMRPMKMPKELRPE